MKPVRFHPAVLAELREAVRYYEAQQHGLGVRFLDAVEGALARIKGNPLLFRVIEANIRKCRVMRFPYGVIFRERSEHIEIVAMMHLHRDPEYWADRV